MLFVHVINLFLRSVQMLPPSDGRKDLKFGSLKLDTVTLAYLNTYEY